ncbi:outer membrane beta-barrel protein [uncultured Sphingomonas sp.]|uniref:outer membrane beta-barrel protein n=1 Tax=uncultured Sphingomonas sp. TaxID=158754 RepID=UPI0035CC0FF3
MVPAHAQSVPTGQGVGDRSRPDYDAIGSRIGAFTLYPSVTATGEATDNYLATDTNRRSDVFFVVRPELYLKSNWARDRVEARAFVSQSVNAKLSGENATQFGASVSSAYEPMRSTQFTLDLSGARYVESRSSLGSFQGSAEPVRFGIYRVGVGASHSFNDLVLGLSAGVSRVDYDDTRFPNGVVVDQDYRDVRSVTAGGSARYDLRNGIGLIVSGQYDDERYDVRPGRPGYVPGVNINRDSSGFNLQGGVTLELSKLIFGSLQVGYISRRYIDPTLNDFGGLSFSGDVLWNITPLTSIRFRASRSIEDTSSPLIAGNTRSDFRLSVDHELYRYVILSGDIGYGSFRPNGIGVGGDEYTVGIGARYLIDRRFSVTAGLRHSGRTSDSNFLRYQATSGNVGVRVNF